MKKKILVGIMAGVMALQIGMFAAAEETEAAYEAEVSSVLEEVPVFVEEDTKDIIISENDTITEDVESLDDMQEPEPADGDAEIQTEEEMSEDSSGDSPVSENMIETIELLDDPDFELAKTAEEGIAVDEINFPDENFRKYVKKLDKDKDNRLSEEEIKKVTKINVAKTAIRSLKGIEYFTYLEYLNCTDNYLEELDLSRNTALTRLICYGNSLSFLNLEKNERLESVWCSGNTISVQAYEEDGMWKFNLGEITGKDNLANISDIQVQDDFGNKIADAYLSEDGIVSVPVDKLPAVRVELCYSYDTKVPVLSDSTDSIMYTYVDLMPPLPKESDLSGMQEVEINEKNFPDGTFRTILRNRYDGNDDGKLDVNELSAITRISAYNVDDLTGIEFFKALMVLECASDTDFSDDRDEEEEEREDHYLKKLDVSGNLMLRELHCRRNRIAELDVSKNEELTVLDCRENVIKKLDLSKNKKLIKLNCSECYGMKKLDISGSTALTELNCTFCDLQELDVSGNTALTELDCYSNKLTELDVSGNTALTGLWCFNNKLTELDVSSNAALEDLDCSENNLTELDVSGNTALTGLYCSENNLTELDVSRNMVLEWLECSSCGLDKLDVSSNAALEYLNCSENNLTELDVSRNMALERLKCSSCGLNKLDVSGNTALEDLDCAVNKLSHLDLEKNTRLSYFNAYNNELPAVVCKKDGIWQLDLSVITGSQNMDRVTLDSEEAALSDDGIVEFQGSEMPVKLVYLYDTRAAYNPVMEISLILERDSSSDCDRHEFGNYTVKKEATALEEGTQVRVCGVCGYEQSESIPKLTPTIVLNAEKIVLQVKQSMSKLKVSGLAKGDFVKSWKSSSQKIVKVNQKGKITAQKKAGTTQVTITLASGLQKKILVTVQKSIVKTTKISGLAKTLTLKKGKSVTLKPVISPITSQEKITYKSSNKKIAAVSARGVVKANMAGTASITVMSGKQKFIVKVIVKG